MNILIKDSKTGKEYLIKGHKLDFEIFKRSEGKMVNGELKGKGDWVTARHYPTTLPNAVYKCMHWILADPDDDETFYVEADKARIKLGKILKDRVDMITMEVQDA